MPSYSYYSVFLSIICHSHTCEVCGIIDLLTATKSRTNNEPMILHVSHVVFPFSFKIITM